MSNSFKKSSVTTRRNLFTKMGKVQSNKKIRRTKGISNGGCFKRVYPSYNVCDYRSYIHPYEFNSIDEYEKNLRK